MMRALIVAVLAVVAAAPLAAQNSPSTDQSASVKRAEECNAAVAGKNMSDAQYRSYLRTCLASTSPPSRLFESSRSVERRCNTIANARQLSAQDRISFMESCRRKGG
jgi:hypothetical protein